MTSPNLYCFSVFVKGKHPLIDQSDLFVNKDRAGLCDKLYRGGIKYQVVKSMDTRTQNALVMQRFPAAIVKAERLVPLHPVSIRKGDTGAHFSYLISEWHDSLLHQTDRCKEA